MIKNRLLLSSLVLIAVVGVGVYLKKETLIKDSLDQQNFISGLPSAVSNTFNGKKLVGQIFPAKTANDIGTSAKQAVSNQNTQSLCAQNSPETFSRSILINEVAWAGTASDKTTQEWIELKNNSSSKISLDGWQLQNNSQSIKVFFDSAESIPVGGFYLLERGSDDFISGVRADKFFAGAIKNNDEHLRLFDKNCNIIDEIIANVGSGKNWPAGTAGPDYRTAERSPDFAWYTHGSPGTIGLFGTPKSENSTPPLLPASTSTPTPSVSATPSPTLSPTPKPTSSQTPTPTPTPSPSITTPTPTPLPSSSNNIDHLLISEIMIGIDGNSKYTFIEFYNPTDNPIDLTGWTVKKKTSSGTESSFIVSDRLKDTIVDPGRYFLTANDTGYTGSIPPDVKWPSSYTLAYTNNSIEVYNNLGEKIEEINWTSIPKNESYERDSWSDTGFHSQTAPNPQNSQSE